MTTALIHELTGDDIRCEWCKLPVAMHPQDANDTFRCLDARHAFPDPKNYRWVSE